MKKHGIAVLAVAVALLAPASAGAAGKKFQGAFANGGTNSFTLKKTKHGKKVFNFEWVGFSLACDGGPATSSDGLTFSVRVRNQKFEAVATPGDPKKAKLTLAGKFTSKVTAEGTMRIEGSRVPLDGGGRDRCDSGKVAWTAERLPN
jgi:hypothetical protein